MTTIHHLALAADWRDAQTAGEYRVSTIGRTVDDEGFIHASSAEQVAGTFERYYTGHPDVLLLTIETHRLTSPWRFDPVGDTTYPHIYGPLNLDAVTDVRPYHPPPLASHQFPLGSH